MSFKIRLLLFWALLLPPTLPAAPPVPETPVAPAEHRWTLTLPWHPQSQFAGFYVAVEKGFFAKRGLAVELRHLPAEKPIFGELADGEPSAVVAPLVTALETVSSGRPVVDILQLSQSSALSIVTRRKSGLLTLSDFNQPGADGRKRRIGIWAVNFGALPRILIAKQKLNVTEVPINDGVGLFLWGAVDGINVMDYNEYYMLLASGFRADELVRFRLRDSELNVPEDGLYVSAESAARYEADCIALHEATLEGWRYALNHRAETLKIVESYCRKLHYRYDPAQQRWMLSAFLEHLALDDAAAAGTLSRFTYDATVKLLQKYQVITAAAPYDAFVLKIARPGENAR